MESQVQSALMLKQLNCEISIIFIAKNGQFEHMSDYCKRFDIFTFQDAFPGVKVPH